MTHCLLCLENNKFRYYNICESCNNCIICNECYIKHNTQKLNKCLLCRSSFIRTSDCCINFFPLYILLQTTIFISYL